MAFEIMQNWLASLFSNEKQAIWLINDSCSSSVQPGIKLARDVSERKPNFLRGKFLKGNMKNFGSPSAPSGPRAQVWP